MKATIVIPGACRTKKNTPDLFPIISSSGIVDLIKALQEAASHGEAVRALMRIVRYSIQPSKGFQEWFDMIYLKRVDLFEKLTQQGLKLPIVSPVSIEAKVYRDADRGDWSGYTQAIGDAIQSDRWRCKHCRKKTIFLGDCPNADCRSSVCNMEHERKGLGLIGDDSQIDHWDGTRLYIDRHNPRVELIIRTLPPRGQAGLFGSETESELI
jgi:hypothetical protein